MDVKIPVPAYEVVANVAAAPSGVLHGKCDSESRVPAVEKETSKTTSYKWSKEKHQVHTQFFYVELYPPTPPYKRNVDGTLQGIPGKAATGGSITDHRAHIVACFMEGGQLPALKLCLAKVSKIDVRNPTGGG